MAKTSNLVKQKWNKEHYAQVKISVNPEMARSFKERCEAQGVSMASELSRFMEGSISGEINHNKGCSSVITRQQRRKETSLLVHRLEVILFAEERYKEAIPENFQTSKVYDTSEQCVETLQEALDLLGEAY